MYLYSLPCRTKALFLQERLPRMLSIIYFPFHSCPTSTSKVMYHEGSTAHEEFYFRAHIPQPCTKTILPIYGRFRGVSLHRVVAPQIDTCVAQGPIYRVVQFHAGAPKTSALLEDTITLGSRPVPRKRSVRIFKHKCSNK